MTGNNFKEKKAISLIFMQIWSRSHLNKLDWLTPQDVYYIWNFGVVLMITLISSQKSPTPNISVASVFTIFWRILSYNIFKEAGIFQTSSVHHDRVR